jgi:hypothetical protein
MPQRPHAAPAEPPAAPPTREQRPNWAVVVGGYDIDRMPIKLAPLPGESVASWLLAVANRYECTVVRLFRALHVPLTSKSPNKVLEHAASHQEVIGRALGLTVEETDALHAPTPLDLAVARYRALYPRTYCGLMTVSRFCPACLAETGGRWGASWSNPIHITCARHRVLLHVRCPQCGQRPWSSPGWVVNLSDGRHCPDYRTRASKPQPRPLRPRCNHDLATTDPGPQASAELLAAQQMLLDLAVETASDPTATHSYAGLDYPSGTCFNAMMALIDDANGFRKPGNDQPGLARATTIALTVLSQPTPLAAARIADRHGLINPAGRCTPLTLRRLGRGTHNPLPVTTRPAAPTPHMSATDQLTFRAAAPIPRPPPGYRSEHREPPGANSRYDSELPLAWLPQQL